MRSLIKTIPFIISLFLISPAQSQCKDYIEAISGMKLAPYVLDGDFVAPVLSEGDSIEVYRTFNSGQTYKVAIVGLDLFALEFKIMDDNKNILFKNYENNDDNIMFDGVRSFEFTLQQSQNLVILVKVPIYSEDPAYRMQGCVGVLVGFK